MLLRSDHNTHSLTAGDRYVKLAFSRRGPAAGDPEVRAPKVPAQAVPGIYMLFVVDEGRAERRPPNQSQAVGPVSNPAHSKRSDNVNKQMKYRRAHHRDSWTGCSLLRRGPG